jgi:hypothetical protein
MFVDFALLVEQQGELLDQIEYNVHAAHEFVQGGNKDIEVEALLLLLLQLLLLMMMMNLKKTETRGGGGGGGARATIQNSRAD